jgi:PKD repeat protein
MVVFSAAPVRAGWFDENWAYRRAIDANWDPQGGQATALCVADFYTAGHARADGSDIRFTTEDGTPIAAQVLMMGPGDRARVVFNLIRPFRRYYVYFGNDKAAPPPAKLSDIKFDCGLHWEMKELPGGPIDNFALVQALWDRAGPVVGQTLIPEPSLGFNPIGPMQRRIARMSGSLFVPIDGEYVFSGWAESRAALWIDGKPVLFVSPGPRDTHNHVAVSLTRGPHDFLLIHVCEGGDGAFLIAWRQPGTGNFVVVGRQHFGTFHTSGIGPLEHFGQTLTADFSLQYIAECFFADGYSHHERFAAHQFDFPQIQYDWDFGDGQIASGPQVDHVYLMAGVYPVKLIVTVGGNSDRQTTRIAVDRLWEHIDRPPGEAAPVASQIAAGYDMSRLSEPALCRAVLLHERAQNLPAMLTAARQLAQLPNHEDPRQAMQALSEASDFAVDGGQIDAAIALWQSVPPESPLRAGAAARLGALFLWEKGNFQNAVSALEPVAANGGDQVKRLYGDALILDQKMADGKKILESLPVADNSPRRVARSGAMARTIEYYITEKDWRSGEEAWSRWQSAFPADFLEGYGLLLRTKLMVIQGNPLAAANVSAAFANAIPDSAYAPQLLDQASRLLATTDPGRSNALRQMLKQRYPEDPLSQ